MQQLPEELDRKRGDACAKNRNVSAKERNPLSFSSDRQSENA